MTDIPDGPDLNAVARDAQVQVVAAEAAGPDAGELGYYEAELRSLRDAATSLAEAERRSG
jgi:hypothetical protein